MAPVAACICLGLPMFTLKGSHGNADDPILDHREHMLFVVGEGAMHCRPYHLKDMFEQREDKGNDN